MSPALRVAVVVCVLSNAPPPSWNSIVYCAHLEIPAPSTGFALQDVPVIPSANISHKREVCCGLNDTTKCHLQAHVIEHLLPGWERCLGRSLNL